MVLTDSESAESEGEPDKIPSGFLEDLAVGRYVLVRYETQQRTSKYFVGLIDDIEDKSITINFMRRTSKNAYYFAYPNKPDIDIVSLENVVLVLGPPINVGGTSRSVSSVRFAVDLTSYAL